MLINFLSVSSPTYFLWHSFINVLIEHHARDCRIFVCCWKPFHSCFARFRMPLTLSFMLLLFSYFFYSLPSITGSGHVVNKNAFFKLIIPLLWTIRYVYYCIAVLLLLFSLLHMLYLIRMFRTYSTAKMLLSVLTAYIYIQYTTLHASHQSPTSLLLGWQLFVPS